MPQGTPHKKILSTKEEGLDHQKNEESSNGDVATVSDGYDNADVLSVSNTDHKDEWILDSGCLTP